MHSSAASIIHCPVMRQTAASIHSPVMQKSVAREGCSALCTELAAIICFTLCRSSAAAAIIHSSAEPQVQSRMSIILQPYQGE
jgi:hypothetical protein